MKRFAPWLAILAWLSLAEWRIFERLLYTDHVQVDFVLESVRGVLAGTPVYENWQSRFAGPLCVSSLSALTADALDALKLLHGLLLLSANLVLWGLLRRRDSSHLGAMLGVLCFGAAHFILTFRLEYPWDWIDIPIFLVFGYWAGRDENSGHIRVLAPLLLIGVFNRESILFIPLWYVFSTNRRQQLAALVTIAVLGGITVLARAVFYKERPNLPGQAFEAATPIISNTIHAPNDSTASFVAMWLVTNAHLIIMLISMVVGFALLARRRATRRPGVWSLCFVAISIAFGYLSEIRVYLPLLAFWFTYAWPIERFRTSFETP